jgi:hypothetical protein
MALGLCWQWIDQTDENRAWRGLHSRGARFLFRLHHHEARQQPDGEILGRQMDCGASVCEIAP